MQDLVQREGPFDGLGSVDVPSLSVLKERHHDALVLVAEDSLDDVVDALICHVVDRALHLVGVIDHAERLRGQARDLRHHSGQFDHLFEGQALEDGADGLGQGLEVVVDDLHV